jgi:predicted LPLAT superfamily acyltransferase
MKGIIEFGFAAPVGERAHLYARAWVVWSGTLSAEARVYDYAECTLNWRSFWLLVRDAAGAVVEYVKRQNVQPKSPAALRAPDALAGKGDHLTDKVDHLRLRLDDLHLRLDDMNEGLILLTKGLMEMHACVSHLDTGQDELLLMMQLALSKLDGNKAH